MTTINEPKFDSFFMAGYECAYCKIETRKRIDVLAQTMHDEYCRDDYRLIKPIGITTVREGLSWSQIDKGNNTYDFARFETMMQIAKQEGIQQIWDLNHFDIPDDVDPKSEEFIRRFTNYARACIQTIKKYQSENIYIIPFNEISFMTWMGGSIGLWQPYGLGKGDWLKKQLVRASISAMDAIWEIDPNVRFIHSDPLMHRVKGSDTEEAEYALKKFKEFQFEAWDMICGKKCPQLGGAPKYLDIIGINYYIENQDYIYSYATPKKAGEGGFEYKVMSWDSKDRISFAKMAAEVYERYKRPIVITETGSYGSLRPQWWKRFFVEIEESISNGIPIYGICAYPIIDRRHWSEPYHLTNSGFWDFSDDNNLCKRTPHEETIGLAIEYLKSKSQHK